MDLRSIDRGEHIAHEFAVETLFIFSLSLVFAVLISDLASRSILSTAVFFLVIGAIAGPGLMGWVVLNADSRQVGKFLEIALVSVLFTDGMRIEKRDLTQGWRLFGRALILGMPITMLLIAAIAWWLARLSWGASLLIGAALSPTDPLFAAAIVGHQEVPMRVRRLLNVESGLNDGLALPAVAIVLGTLHGPAVGAGRLTLEIVLGIIIGLALPWLVSAALGSRYFRAQGVYERLGAISIGLLVYAATSLTHSNVFLAAFVAGFAVSILRSEMKKSFVEFGETIAELLKLAAVLAFGSLLTIEFFRSFSARDYAFMFAVIFVVRPVAITVALAGKPLPWREWVSITWFGPKGVASSLFGFLILKTGLPESRRVFQLVGLVVLASIVAHSSTDVAVARLFKPKK